MTASRRISVVTTSRADFGLYRPLLRRLHDDPQADLLLIAGGMHLSPDFGHTVDEIKAEGFSVAEAVDHLSPEDSAAGIADSMGRGISGYGAAFGRLRPDLVVVLGDRFEMHAAATAALPFNIPLAHIHGGELTQGVIDDAFRHAMTKMSHLHFPSTDIYAHRIRQMGEEDWRVLVSGALGLDNLDLIEPLSGPELAGKTGLAMDVAPLMVTCHPVSRDGVEQQAGVLLQALDGVDIPVVLTAPNADEGGRYLTRRFTEYAAGRDTAVFVGNLGTAGYFGLMKTAAAMVGNSSSGILEAASFELPVVNIGSRQDGRLRAANVIDVEDDTDAVKAAIERAVSDGFRESLKGLGNPYAGKGPAAEIIHQRLVSVPLDERLLTKRFVDR